MSIKVIGSGCVTCQKLYELTKQAVRELGMDAGVEYSTDVNEIVKMGLMQSPVLAVDGKPVLIGKGFSLEKVRQIISLSAPSGSDGETKSSKRS
jgi:small redox-active disulfide protein 2